MYIYIYINLPVNAIVRLPHLPHPRSGDSQGQETFIAPSAIYVYVLYNMKYDSKDEGEI